jgi:hypothetical protein
MALASLLGVSELERERERKERGEREGGEREVGGGRVAVPEGGYLLLYFSSSSASPSIPRAINALVTKLRERKGEGKGEGKGEKSEGCADGVRVAVVVVPCHDDEAEWREDTSCDGWPSIPYPCRQEMEQLRRRVGVDAIPALVVVDPNGRVTTTKGRSWMKYVHRFSDGS